jgi:hypothetical protein
MLNRTIIVNEYNSDKKCMLPLYEFNRVTKKISADEEILKTIKITDFNLTGIKNINNHCSKLIKCVIYFTKEFFEVQKKLIEDIKGFKNDKQAIKAAKLLHMYI